MSLTATEQTIDRSDDQTAPHIHANGHVCPTCGTSMDQRTAATVDEQTLKIFELEKQLTTARVLREQAEIRVKQFEQLTRELSQHIDRLHAFIDRMNVQLSDVARLAGLSEPNELRPAA